MKKHVVAVVAFDGISPFHLSVPCLVFGERESDPPGSPCFELIVCAPEPGQLTTSAGFTLRVDKSLAALGRALTIVVPSWRDPEAAAPAALSAALRRAAKRGARIVGLCLGAFVLADAGLLDGRRATTHWAAMDIFRRRFPQIMVEPDVLYVDDGPLLTSAGTAAGIDCCLHLLRRDHGTAYANHVARRLVVPPHRQGGQAQYVEQPLPQGAGDSRLAGLLDWLRAHLDREHDLDSLAARALMSRRSFTRHFRALTGTTPGEWLLAERLRLSQHLLETTAQPIERIAALAGFGSPASLRLHFQRAFKVAPRQWRQAFGGN